MCARGGGGRVKPKMGLVGDLCPERKRVGHLKEGNKQRWRRGGLRGGGDTLDAKERCPLWDKNKKGTRVILEDWCARGRHSRFVLELKIGGGCGPSSGHKSKIKCEWGTIKET